ncbi:MAG: class I SAM-dependent methyltransferase [Balneolaceae bacterium]
MNNMQVSDLLQYNCCDQESQTMENSQLVCSSCGSRRKIVNGVVLGNELDSYDQDQEGSEVYVEQTLNLYKDKKVSSRYYGRYSKPSGLKDLYTWFVARREVKSVEKMYRKVKDDVQKVLDAPCGTGKLYGLHQKYEYDCVMSDISFEMMNEFIEDREGEVEGVDFIQSNAMKHCFSDRSFDCVMILRLLHRLSGKDVNRVLAEACRVSSKYVIVSNSINTNSLAQRWRGDRPMEHEGFYWDRKKWLETLESYGEVLASTKISPLVSSEEVFLLRVA